MGWHYMAPLCRFSSSCSLSALLCFWLAIILDGRSHARKSRMLNDGFWLFIYGDWCLSHLLNCCSLCGGISSNGTWVTPIELATLLPGVGACGLAAVLVFLQKRGFGLPGSRCKSYQFGVLIDVVLPPGGASVLSGGKGSCPCDPGPRGGRRHLVGALMADIAVCSDCSRCDPWRLIYDWIHDRLSGYPGCISGTRHIHGVVYGARIGMERGAAGNPVCRRVCFGELKLAFSNGSLNPGCRLDCRIHPGICDLFFTSGEHNYR